MNALLLTMLLAQPVDSLPLPPGTLPLPPGTLVKAPVKKPEQVQPPKQEQRKVTLKDGWTYRIPATWSESDVREWTARKEGSRAASPFVLPGRKEAALPQTADDEVKSVVADNFKWPKVLEGMEQYQPTVYTQSIYNLGEETDQVYRTVTDAKWHQSGGMLGIRGYTSRLYKLVPSPTKDRVSRIYVMHSNKVTGQWEVGLTRTYPDGARFIDRLANDKGEDFEARLRFKRNGTWTSRVIFADHAKRPAGYNGIKQSCASCHEEAGTGLYGSGLVPGSDTVISERLPWELLPKVTMQERIRIRNGG